MRTTLSALALAGLLACVSAAADPVPPAKAKPGKADATKKLKVGDYAPRLTVSKFLQGDEVKSFEPGKVYVVEFWATWCGPCIAVMPHVAELADEYRPKGVTVIGFASTGMRDTTEKIAAFVKKRGPKLGYTFAVEDGKTTVNDYMAAAGRNGIPCCFVVDKGGKIAYIGHPVNLDLVLPQVVAGTWDAAKGDATIKAAQAAVAAVLSKPGEDGPKRLAEVERKYPGVTNGVSYTGPKLKLLLEAGETDKAIASAKSLIASAAKHDNAGNLRAVALSLSASAKAKENKDVAATALKAAEGLVAMAGPKDAPAHTVLAETHFALGNKDKAVEAGRKAVEFASAATKPRLKKLLEKYEGKSATDGE